MHIVAIETAEGLRKKLSDELLKDCVGQEIHVGDNRFYSWSLFVKVNSF